MVSARYFLLAVLLLAPGAPGAQAVQGEVLEDSTRVPVAGAIVELFSQRARLLMSARTAETGEFVPWPRPGRYLFRLSHPSDRTVDSLPVTVGRDALLGLELRLGQAAIPIETLHVVGRQRASALSGFEEWRRRPAGPAYFLIRRDLEEQAAVAPTTDLLRSVRGVDIIPVKQGRNELRPADPYSPIQQTTQSVYLIVLRGRTDNGQPALFVDGMRVSQFTEAGIDECLRPDMIEGVEINPGSAALPSGFDASNTCGAVLFWTRRSPLGDSAAGRKTRLIAAGGALLLVLGGASLW